MVQENDKPLAPWEDEPEYNTENGSKAVNSDEPEFRAIEFIGNAIDYWGIWITNLFLSIITLGIYSAWAKVRRTQFFYNNTIVDGFPINYHATGKQLLIGRIIALVLIIVLSITPVFVPAMKIVFFVVLPFVTPWVINKALKFNARMTSWRNIRLNWHGTYWRTFFVVIVAPLIALLSAGFLYPLTTRWYYQYYAKNHTFGTTRFHANSKISSFYWAYFLSLLILVIAFIPLFWAMQFAQPGWESFGFAIGILAFIMMLSVYSTLCRNILVRTLTLGESVKFNSRLGALKLFWILLTNFLAVILTLGLLAPWAAVRRYRYLTCRTEYAFESSLEEFVDEEHQKMSSFGEEFSGLEGIGMSI